MSDRWALALAGSTAIGALLPLGVPLAVAVAVAAVALGLRQPWLLCMAAALAASALATSAWAGLDVEPIGRYEGWVTLMSDPEEVGSGVRAKNLALRCIGRIRSSTEPPAKKACEGSSKASRGALKVRESMYFRPSSAPPMP